MIGKLKVCTTFSGYDSQCLALERLKEYDSDFDYELVAWSEIDKGAIDAHNALFPEYADRNLGDITKIDWNDVDDFDLLTYSSPCQSFSAAGLQHGGEEGSGTRSSLLWEVRRCIEAKKPKYLLLENVMALVSDKFIDLFNRWIKTVDDYGYKSYWQILRANEYGIPQTRPRVFLVSIRKDIDMTYTFPAPVEMKSHLYEYLEKEDDVPVKLFRKKERCEKIIELKRREVAKLEVPKNSGAGYDLIPCGCYCHCSDRFMAAPKLDCSRTLKAEVLDSGIFYKKNGEYFMRLYTTREMYRLMGLRDSEIDKILEVLPDTSAQKCAGNSIVVDVLFHIFRKMFVDTIPDKNTSYILF